MTQNNNKEKTKEEQKEQQEKLTKKIAKLEHQCKYQIPGGQFLPVPTHPLCKAYSNLVEHPPYWRLGNPTYKEFSETFPSIHYENGEEAKNLAYNRWHRSHMALNLDGSNGTLNGQRELETMYLEMKVLDKESSFINMQVFMERSTTIRRCSNST